MSYDYDKEDVTVMGGCLMAMVFLLVFAVFGLLPGAAHAQSFGQMEVPSVQGRAALGVQFGIVLDLQATTIEVEAPNTNRAMGGVIGAALGAFAARDSSWQGQGLAGSVGAFLGDRIANTVSKERRPAAQVVVRLENGQMLAIVQENSVPLAVGDPVYLVGQYPAVRVVKAQAVAQMRNSEPRSTTWGERP